MSAQQYYNGTAVPAADTYAANGYQPSSGYAAPTMAPSQPYAPSYVPSSDPEAAREKRGAGGGVVDTAPFSQATAETGPRLAPRKRLNDPVFLVLFIAALAGYCVVSGLAIGSFASVGGLGGGFGDSSQGGTGTSVTLDYHTVYLFLIVCAVGLLGAALWLGLTRAFTRVIMEITLALSVVLNIGICIYYSGAIIFVVIAVFSIFFYFACRRRIPLARLLFQVTMDVSKHHPSVYVVALIGLVVQTAWSVWYAFTCVAIYVKWTPGSATCVSTSCSSSKVAGLIVYATFDYLWTSQVIANVVLTTLSGGVYGGWYYYGPRAASSGVPRRASLLAFVRSTTLSLGSIAFGSLIVTVLELVRMLLQAVQGYEAGQGDVIGQILSCCAVCCIGCIEGMIRWFNKYAYIEISLYGKAYIPAAKDTWRLMQDRGIDALINDNIVGSVILIGSYVNGFLCAVFGYFYLKFTNPAYNASGQYSAPIILYSFLIGIMEMTTIGAAIDAGVSTIFVGLGEDPMVLAERSPALFDMIRQTYPRVVEGVPR
ncbi:pH nine-sensitive protein 1 [Cryptotrichosporon argae]